MSFMEWLKGHWPGAKSRQQIAERHEAADKLESKVVNLSERSQQLRNTNHLGLAIEKALRGSR